MEALKGLPPQREKVSRQVKSAGRQKGQTDVVDRMMKDLKRR